MKLILLQSLSGAELHEIGDEIERDDMSALRFINKGIAKAKTVKAHNDLMAKAEKLEKEEADKRSKLIAIQKEKELRGEADALLEELVAIVSTLESIDAGYGERFLSVVAAKLGKKPSKKEKEEK